ncbi:MAG: serine/threonine protein kinase [Deltaproteobacteria bacterium]|nr:serine/threonine protein kinase [Deltaproteobacteria bacterium]
MRQTRPFGRFRLMDRIASGGMAEVYRALCTDGNGREEIVALKLVLPHYNDDAEFLEMMRDEAKITRHLRHLHLARVLELGEVDGKHYLAIEYIPGKDLRAIIKASRERQEYLPVEHVLQIIACTLEGLHSAHIQTDERGRPLQVIHRDISPSNIIVPFDGPVKVIDFGIAKAAFSKAKTRIGIIKGKVRYMSPEQTEGKKLDPRSDVFSAGVVLYEALTLRVPFQAPSENEIIELIRNEEPALPSQIDPAIPREVDRVVMKALAKRRAARYPTAHQFAQDLRVVLQSSYPSYQPRWLGEYVAELFSETQEQDDKVFEEFRLGGDVRLESATHRLTVAPPATPPRVALLSRLWGWLTSFGSRRRRDAGASCDGERAPSPVQPLPGELPAEQPLAEQPPVRAAGELGVPHGRPAPDVAEEEEKLAACSRAITEQLLPGPAVPWWAIASQSAEQVVPSPSANLLHGLDIHPWSASGVSDQPAPLPPVQAEEAELGRGPVLTSSIPGTRISINSGEQLLRKPPMDPSLPLPLDLSRSGFGELPTVPLALILPPEEEDEEQREEAAGDEQALNALRVASSSTTSEGPFGLLPTQSVNSPLPPELVVQEKVEAPRAISKILLQGNRAVALAGPELESRTAVRTARQQAPPTSTASPAPSTPAGGEAAPAPASAAIAPGGKGTTDLGRLDEILAVLDQATTRSRMRQGRKGQRHSVLVAADDDQGGGQAPRHGEDERSIRREPVSVPVPPVAAQGSAPIGATRATGRDPVDEVPESGRSVPPATAPPAPAPPAPAAANPVDEAVGRAPSSTVREPELAAEEGVRAGAEQQDPEDLVETLVETPQFRPVDPGEG